MPSQDDALAQRIGERLVLVKHVTLDISEQAPFPFLHTHILPHRGNKFADFHGGHVAPMLRYRTGCKSGELGARSVLPAALVLNVEPTRAPSRAV
jgi:hypothetical protein